MKIGRLVPVHEPGMGVRGIHHAVQKGYQQAVLARRQRGRPLSHFQPRYAVSEREEDRRIGITGLKGLHDLSAAMAHLRGVGVPRFGAAVTLPAIVEQRRVVLLGVEQDTRRSSRAGDVRRHRAFARIAEKSTNQSTSPGLVLTRRKLCVKRRNRVAVRSASAGASSASVNARRPQASQRKFPGFPSGPVPVT
jgi:hypothetical protein